MGAVKNTIGKVLGGNKPSVDLNAIKAQQDAAFQREQDKIKADQERQKMDKEGKALEDINAAESKRRAFVGSLSTEDDAESRRKFLKAK